MKYILGIDPGTNHYSAALLTLRGAEITLINLYTYQYDPKKTLEYKLRAIYNDIASFLQNISPDVSVIEAQYFGGNARTLRSLCESVGAMKIAICLNSDAEIVDYTPNEIKLGLTGYGKASKQDMIDSALGMFKVDVTSDEADAIGVGINYILLNHSSDSFSSARKNLLKDFKKPKLFSPEEKILQYQALLVQHFKFTSSIL